MEAEQIRSIDVVNGVINSLPGTEDPGDAGLSVTFKMHSHFNDVRTRDEGRPIFEMKEYILIQIPGDTTGNVFRPIREGDKTRFPKQWLSFLAGQEQVQGTPLTSVAWLSRAQCDELAFFRIQTVEQLASVSDSNAQRYMGLNELRRKAQQYLETIKSEAPFTKLQSELATRDEQISTMQGQLASLLEEINRLKAQKSDAVGAAPASPQLSVEAERAEFDA